MRATADDPAGIYARRIEERLPGLLAGFDGNPASGASGLGDRRYWAWKLSDFANATPQAAVGGLARLLAAGLLPDGFAEAAMLARIRAAIAATRRIVRPDGSLEEAFPYESSYCVTALVAHEFLVALDLLGERLAVREAVLDIVAPMIGLLRRADEDHAMISNHLATAAAALYRWEAATGDGNTAKGEQLLGRILERQSREGWFSEYGGADPGYQTLCTDYLAGLHRLRPDLGLAEPLARSLRFLWHFAHPDGSFGGLYGARATRFLYPGGIELMAGEIPEAAALAGFARAGIASHRHVGLAAIDDGNLAPMFNSYALAAVTAAAAPLPGEIPTLPAETATPFRARFDEAGLLVDRGPAHYTIVSWKKGGVCHHHKGMAPAHVNGGVLARDRRGRLVSTQAYRADGTIEIDGDEAVVRAPFTRVPNRLPTPLDFILLRLAALTVMRVAPVRRWIKRRLVRMLISGARGIGAVNERRLRLGPDLTGSDRWPDGAGLTPAPGSGGPFSAIHMASQGYWQAQDDAGDAAPTDPAVTDP
ncbi:hypothetical protein [Oceanibacterium hippocampi]|uniref:Heparinase II/III-like protein n=1 Tax=Oceanibacterium hippocampi TaxID=745714 RepID=A0A1Y5S2D1_9PROT|nr:hypothetical protein [Oceanibacterium hippocampi]SLN29676.1 hypothetical protein OCH7691_01022 [Oceanibacterium hippocampi]